LTELQHHAGSMLAEDKDINQWEARNMQNVCTAGSSDCEAIEAAMSVFWGMVNGTSLEVGFLDGVTDSETLHLASQQGFRRIGVEADLRRRERRQQLCPNALAVTAALCSSSTNVHYMLSTATQNQGVIEFMNPGNRFWPFTKAHQEWVKVGKDWDRVNWTEAGSHFLLPCVRLEQILSHVRINVIDFMILDVQGAEMNVLQSINFSAVHINVISMEGNGFEKQILEYMTGAATDYLYMPIWPWLVGRNLWFQRKDFQRRAKLGPGAEPWLTTKPVYHCRAGVQSVACFGTGPPNASRFDKWPELLAKNARHNR